MDVPFEINQYHVQKDIRKTLNCHPRFGINFIQEHNSFVILRNAHKLLPNQSNVYLDRYDSESKLYYYIGKGTTGDQTLTGSNLSLANSKENNQEIHLFWQHNNGSNHQYIGIVQVEKVQEEIQPGAKGEKRKVLVYTLRPIN